MQLLQRRCPLAKLPRLTPQRLHAAASSSSSSSRRPARVAAIAPLASNDHNDQKQQQRDEPRPESSSSSNSSSNSKINKKPSNSGGPDEQREPPRLPPQLTQLLALLVEFAGKLGTAAVVIAWFANVDPFGGLHWDEHDILLGLQFFFPLMLLDAALMLPDYSVGPEDSREVAGLFLGDPDALNNWSGPPSSSSSASPSASMDAEGSAKSSSSSSSRTTSSSGTSSSSSSGGVVLRLRLAMEVLQQVYTRANPGIGLSPAQELLVVAVAALADEMLYRAVGLTLLGLWMRDRLYEAGFDETVSLSWLTPQLQELPTPEFARWAAVALVAGLGATGFALGALREAAALRRIKLLDKDGEEAESEAAAQVKAQLVASLGGQNLVMYGVEGIREVSASVMAGAAFVVTGNLAAPLAGSVAVQTLFSLYQRLSLSRAKTKRKAMLLKMKARSDKLQSAMAAAVAARKAEAAAAPAEAGAAKAGDAGGSSTEEAGSSGSSSSDGSSSDATSPQQEVDFFTAVLQAAEKQQEQERQQRLRPQHASSSGGGNGTTAPAAASADSTAADWASPSPGASSNGSSDSSHHQEAAAAASSSSSQHQEPASTTTSSSDDDGTQAADAAAARQKLSVLLEDMLRSPEGMRVVRQWMDSQPVTTDSTSSTSSSSSGSSEAAQDPHTAVEQLLADPATKAKLLAELEEQLFGMSEAAQRRAKQQETWRN